MHLFMAFRPFVLSVNVFGHPFVFNQRSIELGDIKTSVFVIAEKGTLDINAFGWNFNSKDALCGKKTCTEEPDPETSRVCRQVIDRYGDQWEITSGVRITTRKRFTKPVRLPIWIARSITHPDIVPFGFGLSHDPEATPSLMSSIRHEPL